MSVDWYLDTDDAEAVRGLRHELTAYLDRHAAPGSDVAAAELVASELIGNVARHAPGPAWVSVTWTGARPEMRVYDLGAGFDLPEQEAVPAQMAEGGRGLFIVSALVDRLEVHQRHAGGTVVAAELPVERAPEQSHDPQRHRAGALPALEEALPSGGFGRESFLRALVVQLAQEIERQHGPTAAEAAVAQVGMDVGGQMEEEYRRATQLVGRLSPDQLADCYVRLKHAIDGQFYVVEVTDERIVLGNHRCPFGDVVQRAPALCRMTSSVFGGIGARNHEGGVSIVLEERIAVGDPGCRVVVYLGDPPSDAISTSHRYAGQASGG